MIRSFIKSFLKHTWHLFVNGLLTLLPIAITFSVFSFSLKLLKTWLAPLHYLQEKIPFLQSIPHDEIIIAIALIFLAGIFLKSLIIRSFIELFETMLEQIPFVRPLYTGVKQLVSAFSPSDTLTFQQVVLIEFPQKGMFSVGFQTSEIAPEIAPDKQDTYYNVFIPTTPNPTTGFFVMAKRKDFKPVNLTTQEAMALIMSGGIVQPKRYKAQ
ncbi:MAG: DUF502 domain-containing protein [Candidatus Babeliales bacterium]|jgi:uncharacterized membrane protein